MDVNCLEVIRRLSAAVPQVSLCGNEICVDQIPGDDSWHFFIAKENESDTSS
jgi:hypothetical protein